MMTKNEKGSQVKKGETELVNLKKSLLKTITQKNMLYSIVTGGIESATKRALGLLKSESAACDPVVGHCS